MLTLFLALMTAQHVETVRRPADGADAVAYVALRAMPHRSYGALTWSRFGARAGGGVYWHLRGPGEGDPTRPTGWVETPGRSLPLTACGDADSVRALAMLSIDWNEQAVVQAFAQRGAVAVEIGREGRALNRPDGDQPGRIVWRIEAADRDPAVLSAAFGCTPEGAAHAPRCWTDWRLDLAPASEGHEACAVGGRR